MKENTWKPKQWKPIHIQPSDGSVPLKTPPVKSFFDPQDPSETYEVRGILPRANIEFRDQD